jgi:hypothetical protein
MAAAMDEKDPSFQFWRITTDGNLPLVKYYLETSFNLQNQPESTILALPEIPHELLPPSDFKIYNQGEEVSREFLLKLRDLDVNFQDPEWKRTPFLRACGFGYQEIVKLLLLDPRVDVNLRQAEGSFPPLILLSFPPLISHFLILSFFDS